MRSFPLTVLNGGINRLRVKGGAAASQLYDLQNAYITNAGSIVPREGTIRAATLDSARRLGWLLRMASFNIFSSAFSYRMHFLPSYVLNVLSDPNNTRIAGSEDLVRKTVFGVSFTWWRNSPMEAPISTGSKRRDLGAIELITRLRASYFRPRQTG